MTPEEFVSCLKREVLEDNLLMYRRYLENRESSRGSDTPWRRISEVYSKLSADQKRDIVEIIRHVITDTLSNVLGILDGSTLLEKHRKYFHLRYDDDDEQLNGDLQDLFLATDGE